MRFSIIVILLLIVPKVLAQDDISTSSSGIMINSSPDATKSASASAINVATDSAVDSKGQIGPVDTSTNSAIIDEETSKTALIYTGIMALILIAFIAGKKSSELDRSEE